MPTSRRSVARLPAGSPAPGDWFAQNPYVPSGEPQGMGTTAAPGLAPGEPAPGTTTPGAPASSTQYEIDPSTGFYYPGNRIMRDGSAWLIGATQAGSRQVAPPGSFDPQSGRPTGAAPPGGGRPGAPGAPAPTSGGAAPMSDAAIQAILQKYPANNEGMRAAVAEMDRTFGAGAIQLLEHPVRLDKLRLPDGRVIDAMIGAGAPGAKWGWIDEGTDAERAARTASGGGGAAGAGGFGMLSGGTGSLASLAAGALETSPGFQFRLGEGMKALERSAAAKGTLLTGGTLKGLTRYAQDYASNEYGNQYARLFGEQNARYNQLYGLSNLGLNAAGQQAGLGSSYAGQAGNLYSNQAANLGNLITGQGNAASAGTIGGANAWSQGLSGVANLAQLYFLSQMMNGRPGGSPGGGTPPYFPGSYGMGL